MTPAIQSPADMASLLRRSCPDDADSFARRTHRRAAESADERWAEFWFVVVQILTGDPIVSGERHAGT